MCNQLSMTGGIISDWRIHLLIETAPQHFGGYFCGILGGDIMRTRTAAYDACQKIAEASVSH